MIWVPSYSQLLLLLPADIARRIARNLDTLKTPEFDNRMSGKHKLLQGNDK